MEIWCDIEIFKQKFIHKKKLMDLRELIFSSILDPSIYKET